MGARWREDDGAAARHERILRAVLDLLAEGGATAVTLRAVALRAGVSLGLVNYHYDDKAGLIAAALERVGEQDVAMVAPRPGMTPAANLRFALRHVAEPHYLTTEFLSLRLQLWSLAQHNPEFARINAEAQARYRSGLADLVLRAHPHLSAKECARRASDIDVIQNGIWLTALLGLDRASIRRSVQRCEEIASRDPD